MITGMIPVIKDAVLLIIKIPRFQRQGVLTLMRLVEPSLTGINPRNLALLAFHVTLNIQTTYINICLALNHPSKLLI